MTSVLISESIGTDTRDFVTVALWKAALPASLVVVEEARAGVMHKDAIFTEVGVLINVLASTSTPWILTAAVGDEYNGKEGDGIVWKPNSGAARILDTTSAGIINGIEFDGLDGGYSGADALVRAGSSTTVYRCGIHDNPNATGLGVQINSNTTMIGFSIVYGCFRGFANISASRKLAVYNSGAYNCPDTGFFATGAGDGQVVDSWGYDSGTDYNNMSTVAEQHGFCFASDTSLATGGLPHGNENSKTLAAANFTDAPNGDFRLTAGSSHLLKGSVPTFRGAQTLTSFSYDKQDLAGTEIGSIRFDQLMDIGPEQFTYKPAVVGVPAAPVLVFVSRATGQVTLSVTGDVGVTNQLLFRVTGAFIEGVTRSGDGTFPAQTGLTDGLPYQFIVVSQS